MNILFRTEGRQHIMVKRFTFCMIFAVGLATTIAQAVTYNGSIRYDDGLEGAAVWEEAVLKWTVDNTTNTGLWTYRYTFVVGKKAISHAIVGVSDIFLPTGLSNGTDLSCAFDTYGEQGASTPYIPKPIHGVKCTPSEKTLSYSWTIISSWDPGWTDFYSKSGKHRGDWVFAHNTGFGVEPSDPAIGNGNNHGKVLGPSYPSHERRVREFAMNSFETFRSLMAPEDETEPRAQFLGRYIEVKSESWAYLLDTAGRQIFKPVANYPHLLPALSMEIEGSIEEWMHQPVSEELLEHASQLALSSLGVDYANGDETKVSPARELIRSKALESGETHFHAGRTTVLFSSLRPDIPMVKSFRTSTVLTEEGPSVRVIPVELPVRSHETAVAFAPVMSPAGGPILTERPLRFESSAITPEIEEVANVFEEGLQEALIHARPLHYSNLTLGTFFSGGENRLELTAYSYEGEEFLKPIPPWNPADPPEPYDYCYDSLVAPSVDWVRSHDYYRMNTWYLWDSYGRKNGFRGNWDYQTQAWEIPDVSVVHHDDLSTYPIQFRVDTRINFETCDDPTLRPYDTNRPEPGNKFLQPFYDALEDCHVAMINTHGGPLESMRGDNHRTFSFLRNRDIWSVLREEGDPSLGVGKLRHLILETCSPMNWNFDNRKNIEDDWMNWHVADGIRTVSGYDGTRFGGEVTGWRFFGTYHMDETAFQAWITAALEECDCNVPIVAAYGETAREAAMTLFDGRFSRNPARTGWIYVAEVIPSRVVTEDRACCFSTECSDMTRSECIDEGGRPLDCGTTCEEHAEEHCR